MPAVVTFVRNLPSVDNMATIGEFIFAKLPDDERADRTDRFVRSVNYFQNATKSCFHQFTKHNCMYFERFLFMVLLLALQRTTTDSVIPLASEQQQTTTNTAALDNDIVVSSNDALEEEHTPTNSRSSSPPTASLSLACAVSSTAIESTRSNAQPLSSPRHYVPTINQRVLNVVVQRHCKAAMHPWIYHAMTKVYYSSRK